MAKFETLEGEIHWTRLYDAEESPFKPGTYAWKLMLKPSKESLMKILDMQSLGVKNQLKKDEQGNYTINYNRPTELKNGKRLEPPKVFKADGVTPMVDEIGNGSKAKIVLELYEHKTPTGKAHACRLYSVTVTDLVPYERKT